MAGVESAAHFLERAGLSFGLSQERLAALCRLSGEHPSLRRLLEHPEAGAASLAVPHWLSLRRALWRYRLLREAAGGLDLDRLGPLEIAAARFAARHPAGAGDEKRLRQAFLARAGHRLKHGRLRFAAASPAAALAPEVARFAGHSESCADVAAHRFFAAWRGVADRLLRPEVAPPDDAPSDGVDLPPALAPELEQAASRAVLEAVTARCEDEAIAQAADTLRTLLSRPALTGPVGGLAADGREIRTCVLGGEGEEEKAVFSRADVDGAMGWLAARGPQRVAIFVKAGAPGAAVIADRGEKKGLACEMARSAGLMRQAKGLGKNMLEAAARVAARRARDPLEGYGDLPADEMGLGEYLDLLPREALRAALEDAREACVWERERGTGSAAADLAGPRHRPAVGLSDLRPGMELSGTVSNITGFGVFVELGLPLQGLIHVSELSDRFVRHPSEVVRVGQQLRVRVLSLDLEKSRLSLTLRRDSTRRAERDKRQEALSSLEKLFRK